MDATRRAARLCDPDRMKEQLGKFHEQALASAIEALDAAAIAYEVRDDSPGVRYSPALGRGTVEPPMFDLLVEAERLADAKIAIERWQQEAAEAALRESGAPPPTPEELAADAEWEKQKLADAAHKSSPVWPGLMIIAAAGGVVAWLLLR
jgi:hypothetical protein